MAIKAHVWRSIYVQCADAGKLRLKHLPAIDLALEKQDFPWEILRESLDSGLVRLFGFQNLEGETALDIVLPVLRRAYNLAGSWQIGGLEQISSGELRHVTGHWSTKQLSNKAPAIRDVLFEIEPGIVGGRARDGGWIMLDQNGQSKGSRQICA